jgi:hypothetical protein
LPISCDLCCRQGRHLIRHFDVRHIFNISSSENDIDFFERSAGGFDVEEIYERQEAEAVEANKSQQTQESTKLKMMGERRKKQAYLITAKKQKQPTALRSKKGGVSITTAKSVLGTRSQFGNLSKSKYVEEKPTE